MLVSVLCEGRDEDITTRLLIAETTAPEGRPSQVSRTAVERILHRPRTPLRAVTVKIALLPVGSRGATTEYVVCRPIALERDLPLRDVYRKLERRLEEQKNGE